MTMTYLTDIDTTSGGDTFYTGMVSSQANFVVVDGYIAEIVAGRDSEATLLARSQAITAAIAALTVGTGCPVSSNDTTPGYLNGKLVAGEGVDFTEGNDSGNETLTISCEDTSALFKNYLTGLTLSNDTDTDHDIAIAAGECRDAADSADMALAAVLTKQIDAAWAVGDDAGGMDTGSVGNATLYAIWLIKRSDTGVVDALFSTSFTAPTMPANYDYKRWLGWVLTDGSANIVGFKMLGDGRNLEYWYNARLQVASGLASTSYATQALSSQLPTAIGAIQAVQFAFTSTTAAVGVWLSDDGVNGKWIGSADYTQINIGQANELASGGYGYAGSNPVFVPISGNNIYYKISAQTLTLYIMGARFKR